MSLEWPIVLLGDVASGAAAVFESWGTRVVRMDGEGGARELLESGFVWLPGRTVAGDELRRAFEGFGSDGDGRVGTAGFEAEVEGLRVPLGERVVIAGPKAARFSSHGLVAAAGAPVSRLDVTVRVRVPERIGEHLQAINAETSVLASLAASTGDDMPSWRALALAPLVGTVRGWLGSRGGDRGRAFSVAFLESFAPAAVAAKLWEHRFPESEPAL